MGIRQARGRILLFLDADLIAAPELLVQHLQSHQSAPSPTAVIGPVYGAAATAEQINQYLVDHPDWWVTIGHALDLEDHRIGSWDARDSRHGDVPVPWNSVYGGNLSIPKSIIALCGNFDETYAGWGAEDTDFAYRLHSNGIPTVLNEDASTLHIPHLRLRTNYLSNYLNKRKLHYKYGEVSTELLCCFPTSRFNVEFDELSPIFSAQLIPPYLDIWDERSIDSLRALIPFPSIIMGGGTGAMAPCLQVPVVVEPDQKKVQVARREYPWLAVTHAVGVNTRIQNSAFVSALITDYWRAFPPALSALIVLEGLRISSRVFLLETQDFRPSAQLPTSCLRANELMPTLKKAGLDVAEVLVSGNMHVFCVSWA
jgi:N-terminal domain of galactosyltransferase